MSVKFISLTILKKYLYNYLQLALVLAASLLLTGCAKIVLLSNLPEKEVNEMLAILLSRGIPAQKVIGTEEGYWSIDVTKEDIAQSVDVLNEYGYPHDKFESVGKVFQKSGLVSSPSEERIRFMYALSQSLAETISEIDGVLTARVHVVLQNNDPFSDVKTPASASVFVKYRRGSGVEGLASQIKRLVANSIEGLNYDKISLIYVPSDINPGTTNFPIKTTPPIAEPNTRLPWIIALAVILFLILVGGGWYLWHLQQQKSLKSESEKSENR